MLGFIIFLMFAVFFGIGLLLYLDRARARRKNEMLVQLGLQPRGSAQTRNQAHAQAKADEQRSDVNAPDCRTDRKGGEPDRVSAPLPPAGEKEQPIFFKLLEMEARTAPKAVAPKVEPVDTATLIAQLQRISQKPHSGSINRHDRKPENVRTSAARQPGPCTLRIDYVDANGVCTTRDIAPYRSGNTNERFHAWCGLRQERRTFFFERIRSAVHISTGHRLDRAAVFRHIHPDRRVPQTLL